MKKCLIVFVLIGVFLSGCIDGPKEGGQKTSAVPAITETPRPDVSGILENAIELREEKLYFVTLEFKKEQFTLDPWKAIANEASAEHRVIMVGERTFDQYEIGKEISSKGDALGFIFNGELSEYVVKPTKKEALSQFFWVATSGNQSEISKGQYDEAMRQLKAEGRQVLTVPYSGSVRTAVLEKPLSQYEIVGKQPIDRYFMTIEVKSETFTLSIVKMLRNEANAQEITIEVPKEVFDRTGDAWDPQLSGGSLVFKGHISELRGRVIKKWQEKDEGYVLIRNERRKGVHRSQMIRRNLPVREK